MMTPQTSKRQFTIFMIGAFALGWILQIIASIFANKGDNNVFRVILAVCMYMPLLSVLIARIPLKGMGFIPHLKGKIGYIFFSLWMPAVLSIIGGVLFFVIFPNAYDGEFETMRSLMQEAGALKQLEAQGLTIKSYLVISTIQAVTIAPFLNMLFALGEEIGW
ncbi:MAG: hypothetical protein IJ079_09900, partial [Lachnospiraceae bacterium]|nr:hypothetical protein [Lachnospiraceae bacterium]